MVLFMVVKTVRISSKGQITLPKELREKYQLREGDEALILSAEEGVLIKQKKVSLRGFLAERLDVEGFEKDLKRLRREWTTPPTS
jgi:AbrB family looped-hinge helix DNA binding protein